MNLVTLTMPINMVPTCHFSLNIVDGDEVSSFTQLWHAVVSAVFIASDEQELKWLCNNLVSDTEKLTGLEMLRGDFYA